MKKVLYLYDSLSQKINMLNLTNIECYKQYLFDDVFISDYEDISLIYSKMQPNILILNIELDYNKQMQIIESISKTFYPSKIIMIIGKKRFQEMLFTSKIPNRVFFRNVAKDTLANTISALLIEKNLALEEIYKIKKYNDLIENFRLKKYNSATKHFIKCIYILYNNVSLLDGHLNNAYYVVSKYDNVCFEAVKKSIIRVIDTIKVSSNTEFICSIFGYKEICFHTPQEVLNKIIEYMKKVED